MATEFTTSAIPIFFMNTSDEDLISADYVTRELYRGVNPDD